MTNIRSEYRGVVYYHEYLARGQSRYWTPITGEDKFYRTEEMVRSVIDDHLARMPNAPSDGNAEVYRGVWYRVNLYGLVRKRLQYFALRPGPEGVYDSKEELCAAIDEFIARQPKPQPSMPTIPATPPPPPSSQPPAAQSAQGQVVINIPAQPATKIMIQCRHCGSLFEASSGKCNSCGAPLYTIGQS